jgi:DedD protein
MARPVSDEELQLKKRARRRLVGAIVLVTAVAVVLPMVLDSGPKPVTQNVEIQIPSPDSGEFKAKTAAVAPSAPAAPATVPSTPIRGMPATPAGDRSATAAKDSAPKGTPEAPAAAAKAPAASQVAEADTAAKAAAKDEKAAAKETPKAAASTSGTYVVQVAALADAARVKQLQKQMSAVGVKAYTEAISTKSGEITRVRAGPYATKEAAESARSQLKKAGLDGKVVPK